MDLETRTRLIILAISVLLSLIVIINIINKRKKNPESLTFIMFQVLFIIWFLGQILRIFAPNYHVEWYFVRFEYFAISFLGLVWLIFCLYYIESKFVKKLKNIVFLSFLPVFSYITLLTNDIHHLFFKIEDKAFDCYNCLFYLHAFGSYLYLTAGIILLAKYAINHKGFKKIQAILLIIATILPMVVNFLLLIKIIHTEYDCTPFSMMASILLYMVATLKYNFLNILPIALREIVDNMKDAILVVDNSNRIVDFNYAFPEIFPGLKNCLKNDIQIFIEVLENLIDRKENFSDLKLYLSDKTKIDVQVEIEFAKPQYRSFKLNIRPIKNGQEIIGRIISINEITEYTKLLKELNAKNIELLIMNRQLREYAATAEELAIAKERNRFARDVHDTLGQTMTLLITLLQVGGLTCRTNPASTEEKILEAIKIAEDGLSEVRRSLIGLNPGVLKTDNLIDSLNKLIADFLPSEMKISLTVNGDFTQVSPINLDIIYRLCQEALTNSLRHGKAEHVSIAIGFLQEKINIRIFDDGFGCKDVKKGYGLYGMEERVNSVGGTIRFYQENVEGFGIHVELPTESEKFY